MAKLSNGVEMPWLGFGTFKVTDESQVIESVKEALKVGYRHIDTASIYGNEEAVGEAILQSDVKREDIFLVSKVWNTDQGYDSTLRAFEESLNRLKTNYLDLYLIHWPNNKDKNKNIDTWRALERLYKEKRVRAIGVSNFKIHHLEELLKDCEIIPMVNQVEFHPQFPQTDVHEFCKNHNIQLEAWGPLMQGKAFEIETLQKLAEKYNKTVSQIVLRWDLQMGVVTIPKSINPVRIRENADIFGFEISDEDMKLIESLNIGVRIGLDPDDVEF